MIVSLTAPCFVLDPSPNTDDGGTWHHVDVEAAARALHEHLSEIRADNAADQLARAMHIVIVQNAAACKTLTCDGCGDEFEDDETAWSHLMTDEDERTMTRMALDSGWTGGEGNTIHCTRCPTLIDPAPGPSEYDVPLFGMETVAG
jgi:hypothetical protein